MPRTLPYLRGIQGGKHVRLEFFAFKLLNHAILHLRCDAIFFEMTSVVSIELGTHGLDRPHDSFLLISGPLRSSSGMVRG